MTELLLLFGTLTRDEWRDFENAIFTGRMLILEHDLYTYVLQVAHGTRHSVLRVYKDKWDHVSDPAVVNFLRTFAQMNGCSAIDYINSPRREEL